MAIEDYANAVPPADKMETARDKVVKEMEATVANELKQATETGKLEPFSPDKVKSFIHNALTTRFDQYAFRYPEFNDRAMGTREGEYVVTAIGEAKHGIELPFSLSIVGRKKEVLEE